MNGQNDKSLSHLSVLLVDDHYPIRCTIRELLRGLGISTIRECTNGDSAKRVLDQSPIDLIISDIYMEPGDGLDLLRFVRSMAFRADVPFIMVTGEDSKDMIIKTTSFGANAYLVKPFQADVFCEKVQTLMDSFLSPNDLLKTLREGDRLLAAQQPDLALEKFRQALAIKPDNNRAQHSEAVAMIKCGKYSEAITCLKENIEVSPNFPKNYKTLSDLYVSQNNIKSAIPVLRKEVELNPLQPERQALLGDLLRKEGKYETAKAHYTDALKESSKQSKALLGMAICHVKIGDIEKALYYTRRHRRSHPESNTALKMLVKIGKSTGNLDIVEKSLKDEMNRNPKRLDTYLVLSDFYLEQGMEDKSAEIMEKFEKRDPADLAGKKVRARYLFENKKLVEAIPLLESILKKETSPSFSYMFASCLYDQGRHAEAVATINKGLEESPGNSNLLKVLLKILVKQKFWLKGYALCSIFPRVPEKVQSRCLGQIKKRRQSHN